MKKWNLKYLLAAAALIPSLASALDQQSKEILDFSLSQQKKFIKGLEIRPVSRELIEEALKKVGGKAQVEFKSGGVIIGSGADGLVATSNTRTKEGATLVRPPVVPDTSITIVGRPGTSSNQPSDACALRLKSNSLGELLPNVESTWYCKKLGIPLRLEAGKYILYYSDSFMLMELKKGDKKIIPLREVVIPGSPQHEVHYSAHREGCSSQEIKKSATLTLTKHEGSNMTLKRVLNAINQNKQYYPDWICAGRFTYKRNTYHLADLRAIDSGNLPNNGSTFSVLPGTYRVEWLIDSERASTRNIVID